MKSIQIGRDINVAWSILEKGAPYNLEGLKTNLYLKDMYGKSPIAFSVEGNVIFWTFRGADQKHTGKYSLELVINEGENNMVTTDARNFVNLVFHDCSNEEGYEIDSLEPCNHDPEVEISSELGYVAMIVDTELSETSENAVSNKAVVAGLNSITSDWEAAANEKGYIKNKPFGEIYNKLEWYYDDNADGVLCDTAVDKVFIDGKEYDLTLGEILNIDNTNFGIGIDEYFNKVKVYGAREDDVDWVTNNVLTGGVIKTIDERYIPNTIARTNGYYQSVTVGYSDNLVGRGESTPEMFSFRASGGRSINDGAARIKTLRGNAVVWNQALKNNGANNTVSGVTITKVGNEWHCSGVATDDVWFVCNDKISVNAGHKYLYKGCPSGGSTNSYLLWEGSNYLNRDEGNGSISTLEVDRVTPFIVIRKGIDASGLIYKPVLIDLTQMFGAGNEPTSVEEFNAILPLNVDVTAYNEGEVIPFNGVAIKSVGDNAWDEEWESGNFDNGMPIPDSTRIRSKNFIKVLPDQIYNSTKLILVFYYDDNFSYLGLEYDTQFTIPSNVAYIKFSYGGSMSPISTYQNDICISLAHSGYKEGQYSPYTYNIRNIDTRILEMFPDGMNKWDKVYNKNGRGYVVKGTGKVDMGTLSYAYQPPVVGSFPLGFFYVDIANKAHGNINMLSGKYDNTADWVNVGIRGDESAKTIYVKDGAFADATSFKAAMQGVMLYYELAEPQVYEFAEPFNLDYEVADFGTEEILSEKPSAPISADIIYQFNAVDSIRDLLARIAALESKIK